MHLCAKQRPGNSSMAHQEALLSSSPAKFNANLCENFSTGSFIFRAPWILCILKFKFSEKATNIWRYVPFLFDMYYLVSMQCQNWVEDNSKLMWPSSEKIWTLELATCQKVGRYFGTSLLFLLNWRSEIRMCKKPKKPETQSCFYFWSKLNSHIMLLYRN